MESSNTVLGSINAYKSTAIYYDCHDIYINCGNLQRLCCFPCWCCSGFSQPEALLLSTEPKLHLDNRIVTDRFEEKGADSSTWGEATCPFAWSGLNPPKQSSTLCLVLSCHKCNCKRKGLDSLCKQMVQLVKLSSFSSCIIFSFSVLDLVFYGASCREAE